MSVRGRGREGVRGRGREGVRGEGGRREGNQTVFLQLSDIHLDMEFDEV